MTTLDSIVVQRNAFEEVVRTRHRPGYVVKPVSIAWDAVAFGLQGARDGIACIPRSALEQFLDDLDDGRLDAAINGFLASPPSGRVLRAADQASKPGLFDELASPGAIVPEERVPGRGPLGGFGGGTPADARRNKNRRAPRPSRVLVTGVMVAAVIVLAAVALVAKSGDNKQTVATKPTSTATEVAGSPVIKATFTATFTVTSEKAGKAAHERVALGDATTSSVVVECDVVTCTLTSDSTGFDRGLFGLTFTRSGDHLEGARSDSGGSDPCAVFDAANLSSTIDMVRDAGGKVTGFTGTYVIVHPNGVESPDGRCASEEIATSFVGVPA
ncbi:MAG: hypothetical protein QOG30_2269 [Acidimicrobiaceae bacterium]